MAGRGGIAVDGSPAPRLAAVRPDRDLLVDWFDQLRGAMLAMSAAGFVHGDLSPYNVLAAGERVQPVDPGLWERLVPFADDDWA